MFNKISPLQPALRAFYAFLLATSVLYLSVICFRGFFDRYLLFPMFALLPIVATLCPLPEMSISPEAPSAATNFRVPAAILRPVACLFIFMYAVFGVAGTHDYFDWNRARWQAVHDLVDVQSVSPMEVDGGLEFNGWYGYDPKYRDAGGITLAGDMRHNNEYVLSMQPLPDFEVLSRYSYQRWLPWGAGEIVVLHKVH
jgi:hypothetical protein